MHGLGLNRPLSLAAGRKNGCFLSEELETWVDGIGVVDALALADSKRFTCTSDTLF